MKPVRDVALSVLPAGVDVTLIDKSEIARGAALQAQHVTNLMQSSTVDMLRAVSCMTYSIALLPVFGENVAKPRTLVARGQKLPFQISRTLRPQEASPTAQMRFPDELRIIEGTAIGGNHWHFLSTVKPQEKFPERDLRDPLLLQLNIDESGILASQLVWPAGNVQLDLPPTLDHSLSAEEILQWNHWLETAMLCSTD